MDGQIGGLGALQGRAIGCRDTQSPASPAVARAPQAAMRPQPHRATSWTRAVTLLDHLVGTRRESGWHFKPEGLGGLEIDHELEFRGLINRQLRRLLALEYAPDIASRTAIAISNIGPIAHQTAGSCGGTGFKCRGNCD